MVRWTTRGWAEICCVLGLSWRVLPEAPALPAPATTHRLWHILAEDIFPAAVRVAGLWADQAGEPGSRGGTPLLDPAGRKSSNPLWIAAARIRSWTPFSPAPFSPKKTSGAGAR